MKETPYQKRWRQLNNEHVSRRNKVYFRKKRMHFKKEELKRLYGITWEEYKQLLRKQKSRCAVCQRTFRNQRAWPSVDHCHKTGKVRGLLHNRCNQFLGIIGDDCKKLKGIIKYLQGK